MKKMFVSLILTLLCVFTLQISAFAQGDFNVEKVDFSVELREDGSALVTENWSVSFPAESDGFTREIVIPEDDFEVFGDVRDMSVSVDGNGCSEVNDSSSVNGTYSVEKTENKYVINWHMLSKNETRTFSLRYVQTQAVKLYNGKAYYFCTVVNEDSSLICRNVTVSVKTPDNCFSEDFSIVESGSLAGKKSDGEVVFSAVNSAGHVKTGLSMPGSLFDASHLTVIEDDNSVKIALIVILVTVFLVLVGASVFLALNYRKLFRQYRENKCRNKAQEESSYEAQFEIFEKFSPARILNIVSEKTVSDADMFIVTFLDLLQRGYISVSSGGFTVSETSEKDSIKRPLVKSEKFVLDIFRTENWQKRVLAPKKFYSIVQKFNKTVGFVPVFYGFVPGMNKIIRRCFELKLSANRHEFVYPEEISDDIFRNGKYSATDLIISVLNEYSLSLKSDFEKTGADRFNANMFILREIYEEGRIIADKEEAERKLNKK